MKKSLIFLVSLCFVACSPKEPDVVSITAITGEATQISCRNAVLAGKANLSEVTATDLSFGVLYSTNSGVLLGKADKVEATTFDSEYNYTITTAALEPETTYYYRSFISQNNEIVYGDTKSFTTQSVSTMIKTDGVTDINPHDVTLHATLNLTGCLYAELEYGFVLTSQNGQEETLQASNLSNAGYSLKVENLSREQEYHFYAYAILDGKTYVGENKKVTTETIQATISLGAVEELTEISATVSGGIEVISLGVFSKEATLYYSATEQTKDALKAQGTSAPLTIDSDNSFSHDLTNLSPNTTYYFMVVASIDDVLFESEVMSFQTKDYTVQITTAEATDIANGAATLCGNLTINSIADLGKEVFFLYSETESSIDGLKSSGAKVLASITGTTIIANLIGVKPGTRYYYVAGVRLLEKEYLGSDIKSFVTTDVFSEGAVDMGLSVKWSSCNLGATKPEEVGNYYHWAKTTPTTATSADSYSRDKYYIYGDKKDNKVVLDAEDDAAAQVLGGKWRMPTAGECRELIDPNKCTCVEATHNGVRGYMIVSKITKNSIFIPASGEYHGNRLYYPEDAAYWSSSLSESESGNAKVWALFNNPVRQGIYGYGGSTGLPIRPVLDDDPGETSVTMELTVAETGVFSASITGEVKVSGVAFGAGDYWMCVGTTQVDLRHKGEMIELTIEDDGTFKHQIQLDNETTYYYTLLSIVHKKEYTNNNVGGIKLTQKPLAGTPIDMGLSVKWSSVNLCATDPEGPGAYFAWGATSPKSSLFGSNDTWTDYNNYSNTVTLLKKDDAAAQHLGNGWRIPTIEELQELADTAKCSWVWCNKNGVNGYLVTSKITNNSIFLPAAGYHLGSSIGGNNKYGFYLSSTHIPAGDSVWGAGPLGLAFTADIIEMSNQKNSYWSLYILLYRYGFSVRPVCQ